MTNWVGRTILSFLVVFMFVLVPPLKAQNEKLTASASATTIATGDQVQITYSLNASGKGFKAPAFADFDIVMGPSQSQQMQIINGSVSQTLSFTYVLQATKEGVFKFGAAEISVGSNKIYSNPLTITVTKGKPQTQSGSGQKSNPQDNTIEGGGKNVFIKASVDRTNTYQGEGIVVSYKLYTKVTLLNYAISKLPSFAGFWSQDINMQQQLDFHDENYDGITYKVAEIKKVVLFPQRSGTLTVDPMEGEVIARVQVKKQQQQRSNDPFSQFFNDPFFNNPFFNNNVQDVKVNLKSDPIRITVKALPDGAPADFSGAVGRLSCEVTLDKKETKANEAVTLKVKISGKGNIKLIDSPKITFPPDFESYDPKENSNITANNSGVSGTKTFEYLIIPRNAGDFKIPISSFIYFDLDKKQYVGIDFPDMMLKVTKGDGNSVTVAGNVQRSDVQLLGKDIRFIKTKTPDFNKSTEPIFGSPVFYGLIAAPALLFFALLGVRKRNEKLMGNMSLVKSQRANKAAMKRLSAAKKYLSSNEKEKFLDEMFRALWGFIGDKLQIPVADLSKEKVASELTQRNVDESLIKQFIETIDSCEFARFAGGIADSNESIYQKGIDIITKLESSIK
jgi:hypothetical protein